MIYIEEVKKCINKVKEQCIPPIYTLDTISNHLFLEMLLMEIRGKTISHSAYKMKQNIADSEQSSHIPSHSYQR